MSDTIEQEQYIKSFFAEADLPTPVKKTPVLTEDDDLIELGDNFDFDGFQVVRREFFAHMREPSISFARLKFHVNQACLARFPDTDYVQVLINRETKIMALRPCEEGERDSFEWTRMYKGKKVPKDVNCKLFFAKIFSMMGWNPDYRYKLLGRVIHSKGIYLLAFDLNSTEVYQKKINDEGKLRMSRTPTFPASWQNQFGLSYNEHQQSMHINIFDGYAVYAIKDASKNEVPTKVSDNDEPTTTDNLGGDDVAGIQPFNQRGY